MTCFGTFGIVREWDYRSPHIRFELLIRQEGGWLSAGVYDLPELRKLKKLIEWAFEGERL